MAVFKVGNFRGRVVITVKTNDTSAEFIGYAACARRALKEGFTVGKHPFVAGWVAGCFGIQLSEKRSYDFDRDHGW